MRANRPGAVLTAAERRVGRAIAGALARVDALWNADELERLVDVTGRTAPERLRERIVDALAVEPELAIVDREAFETLVEAVRMSA